MNAVSDAREALGARLRELRRGARLTGLQLAGQCGWHSSKVSRIERGQQSPSEEDLAKWCQACDTVAVLDDLVATLRNVRAAYVEWQRTLAAGHAHRQRQSIALESRTEFIRWWTPDVVPGLLQTEAYARGVLTACIAVTGGRDDLDDAVRARMDRQRVLRGGRHQFHIVIWEPALWRVVADRQTMADQLARLAEIVDHPRVRFGIVPLTAEYRVPATNFVIYDRSRVITETVSAELTITRPSEILLHEKTFGVLADQAVYGDAAREILGSIASRHNEFELPE
ncbi:transcriptional regulator [Nocardia nova SH22a]|uniref:Transcriptional regulator n=1 Tax=Nocardia nova SH22a TaxID=1415166 RepID=W5TD39_9NOCA|nr:helix-turn-helix transcriptional regulator [Nocardia nova]AHH17099.1 transcriptional regulator [Nocardia nova SH22a]